MQSVNAILFIIMDEPQEGMDTDNSSQIAKLNHCLKNQYSATHKVVVKNSAVMLNTYVDSYKDGLVKENRSIDCY
jgi:restriction endonuclease